MRVSYQELFDAFVRVLAKTGLDPDRAGLCARLIADASRDGVPSHGLNLFPRLIAMQTIVREVPIARHVQDYAVRLLQSTHPTEAGSLDMVKRFVKFGASPRGAQALLLAAKIKALFEGRFAASVDDVRASALPALRHRVLLNFEGEAEGVKTDEVLNEILKHLPETTK